MCFHGAVVDIRMHKEFSINPTREPAGHSMPEFTKFLHETFSLPRDAPVSFKPGDETMKPRMMVISRRHPRKLMNVDEVVRAAERVGFEVVIDHPPMEHIGKVYFGDPTEDMQLKYIAYSAGVDESTLVETLGRDHPAVRVPESVHQSGLGKVAEHHLGKQDIRLDLARFEPVLRSAMDLLKEN
ncbi:beta-1,2-xylosyltransferase XYXT1-like [Oryza brachyantha]|uniref:Uncharacterized protein n=1 Tax=Oryza brachyantha TaxID=4533 RepID=J3LIQ4_ORYBR|nr:beta-1,2-xylosyltransferase XYXT1-like [Oryza brachyantha]